MDLNPYPLNPAFPRKKLMRTHGKKKKEDFGDFTEELFLVGFLKGQSIKGLEEGPGKDFGGWQYS